MQTHEQHLLFLTPTSLINFNTFTSNIVCFRNKKM